MNDEAHCTTKHGVSSKLSQVTHAIMASIPCKYHLLSFEGVKDFFLIFSPKGYHCWNEKVPLMVVVGGFIVNQNSHVLETVKAFYMEAPAHRTAKLRRRFSAGNFPRRKGWLFHVNIPLQALHFVSIVRRLPVCEGLTSGLGAMQR